MKTWLIIGASRGIGLEFVNQLLQRKDTYVFAAARNPATATLLETATYQHADRCKVLKCDIVREESVKTLVDELASIARSTPEGCLSIDYCVFNAGVLRYPNRATEMTFDTFKLHLHTNTIGPIVLAAQLLKHHPHALRLSNLTFISSDSGSAGKFLSFEDGFAAYGASKAALNQSIRHMAAELGRKGVKDIGVFALHPGEVATDMADVEVEWVVEGVMQPEESVRMCIEVIEARTSEESGTFWTWKDEQYPW